MTKLMEWIKSITEMPYIDESGIVMDGSFDLYPVITGGIEGNGEVQNTYTTYSCNVFLKNKEEMVKICTKLWKELCKQKYVCDQPDYTYENEGHIWRGTLMIQAVEEEENAEK